MSKPKKVIMPVFMKWKIILLCPWRKFLVLILMRVMLAFIVS